MERIVVVTGFPDSEMTGMKIEIRRKTAQPDGRFNGGAVLEKRPVLFRSPGNEPYSNLFYWAHAWSDEGSTIGLHPHTGFEILSFVLKGTVEHFDTKNNTWIPLMKGGAQIIRAGSGIAHSEKLNPGSAIFQIWFDPDLSKTLGRPASYNDYAPESFPETVSNGIIQRVFKGENGPIEMETAGTGISEIRMQQGHHTLEIPYGKLLSAFMLEGRLELLHETLEAGDFFRTDGAGTIEVSASENTALFIIESPSIPPYTTYAEMHQYAGQV